MAIAPTGAIYKTLTFDGENSGSYGVYITGEAVYNAPERDVEMITIPGRNGAYALDKGRFQNIEVTYPAGMFADNEVNWAQAISDFRNMLCSKRGYVRLTDEYNPNEYRLAIYKSGLEVDPKQLRAGEFDITFECKPQRFLTSGEEKVTMGVWGPVETETGPIVTIEADDTTAIKDLTADIEPIQDLHGYNAPWVGGAGKNLFNPDTLAEGYIGYDGSISAASTTQKEVYSDFIPIEGGSAYVFSMTVDNSSAKWCAIALYDSNKTFVKRLTNGWTSITLSATDTEGMAYARATYRSYGIATNMQFEKGTTPTTYEPYENICPISGHTDVVVTVADDYDNPTVSDTYTTALGTTVYGGTLDVTTGVLTVTHGYVDLGTLTWTKFTSAEKTYFRTTEEVADMKKSTGSTYIQPILCSNYEAESWTHALDTIGYDGVICEGWANKSYIAIADSTKANLDGTSFKTAMNGVQLVYELATPTTTTLTAQQIDLLLGTNNIWADTGDVTLEYGQNPNVIINPTLFESSPLLEVDGYGDLNLNADTITIENAYIGNIPVASEYSWGPTVAPSYNAMTLRVTRTFDTSLLNVGDTITLNGPTVNLDSHETADTWTYITNFTYSNLKSASANITSAHTYAMRITFNDLSLTYGTPFTSSIGTMSFNIYNSNGSWSTPTPEFQIVYDGADSIKIYWDDGYRPTATVTIPQINANSTKSALLSPIYIDLDIGEAYGYESGSMVSLDNVVSMPATLPTLKPGANAISHDNTITGVEIIPRWWKV